MLDQIDASVIPEGTTPAGAFFSGLAKSGLTGDPSHALKGLIDLFTMRRPNPADRCQYFKNPLGLTRTGTGDLSDLDGPMGAQRPYEIGTDPGKRNEAWGNPTVYKPIVEMMPEGWPCKPEDPSEATRYRLKNWIALVRSQVLTDACDKTYIPKPCLLCEQPKPGTHEENLRCAKAHLWASWQILTDDEIARRYRLEVRRDIVRMLAKNPDVQTLAEMEDFYGGRVVDGATWHWDDETMHGRKVGDWPRWVPLEDEAKVLRSVYATALSLGIDNVGLGTVASTKIPDPVTEDFAALPLSEKNKILAKGLVVAAAKAKGENKAFLSGLRVIEAICPTCEIGQDEIRAALRDISKDVPILGQTRAQKASSPSPSLIGILGPGLFIVAGILFAMRKIKGGRKNG